MRSVGSSAAAARNASASFSSSASDTGNPRIRCRWPRAVSTSTNGCDGVGVIADEEPGGSSPASAPARVGIFPADLVAASAIDWALRCWLCCAASLFSTSVVC